jgi:uncharacterized BrkB/YihY/UPF0761 family membrane protein
MANKSNSPAPTRRIRFALIVLVSQLLLIALALAWAVHMVIIAVRGSVYFVEDNLFILWLEISVTILICIFGVVVFIMQLHRLNERRRSDETRDRRG